METNDLQTFIDNFSLIDNTLQMRCLKRWNGRDLRTSENLSEHTHLVLACAIKLYETIGIEANFEKIVKLCMYHDALELFRGDILSITKDAIPGLRKFTDEEEDLFMSNFVDTSNGYEKDLVKLADLMACYKFIEYELRFPSNDYAYIAYEKTKQVFDNFYTNFCKKYNLKQQQNTIEMPKMMKGYKDDAGTDIILDEDVIFLPHSTTKIDLKVIVTPKKGEMALLCARTSAAAQGLNVAMCPIDANFNGTVTAIVHNISNNVIRYSKGSSFCQWVGIKLANIKVDYDVIVKKTGKRSSGKLGSTGGTK
jgi:5'-deoxynucleotidase YfbR-like HD superfamily hydrolase